MATTHVSGGDARIFADYPFGNQRMLVEIQSETFRHHTAPEFWAYFMPNATALDNAKKLPDALAYVTKTIENLEEVARVLQEAVPNVNRSILSLLKANCRAILFHDPQKTTVPSCIIILSNDTSCIHDTGSS